MKKLRSYIFCLLIIPVCLLAACGPPAPNEATITMKEMVFVQSGIIVKAGQSVILRPVNRDGYAHAFDIDESVRLSDDTTQSCQIIGYFTNKKGVKNGQ